MDPLQGDKILGKKHPGDALSPLLPEHGTIIFFPKDYLMYEATKTGHKK